MMSFFGLREWQFCNKNIDQLATLLKSQQKYHTQKQNGFTGLIQSQNDISQNSSVQRSFIENDTYLTADKSIYKSHNFLEFDMRTIDWDDYFSHYLPGIKRYFFKESIPDNKICIKHYRRYTFFYAAEIDRFNQIFTSIKRIPNT